MPTTPGPSRAQMRDASSTESSPPPPLAGAPSPPCPPPAVPTAPVPPCGVTSSCWWLLPVREPGRELRTEVGQESREPSPHAVEGPRRWGGGDRVSGTELHQPHNPSQRPAVHARDRRKGSQGCTPSPGAVEPGEGTAGRRVGGRGGVERARTDRVHSGGTCCRAQPSPEDVGGSWGALTPCIPHSSLTWSDVTGACSHDVETSFSGHTVQTWGFPDPGALSLGW